MPFLVTLQGNIGAGKSTILSKLESHKEITVVPEPLETWNELREKALEQPKDYTFEFQKLVLKTMFDNHLLDVDSDIKVMERSIDSARYCFTDYLYSNDILSKKQHETLDSIYQDMAKNPATVPNLIIYVNTRPTKCLERIRKRNRSGEEKIDLEEVNKIHIFHETWLKDNPLVVNINGDTEDENELYEECLSVINQKYDEWKNAALPAN